MQKLEVGAHGGQAPRVVRRNDEGVGWTELVIALMLKPRPPLHDKAERQFAAMRVERDFPIA
jgi:hypothetical protein